MPKTRRYKTPAGRGWRGGIMGGSLRFESGDKPWTVQFTDSGKIEKYKRFAQEKDAKTWRRKYSNKTGRTTNIWRLRPNDPNTVEMIIGPNEVVLFETRFSQELLRFEWHLGARGRVYTTGRVRTSPEGINAEAKPMRKVAANKQVAMVFMLNPDIKNPRRRTPIVNGIIDNRLSNFTTLSELNRARHQKNAKARELKRAKEKAKAKKAKAKKKKKASSRKEEEDTLIKDAFASESASIAVPSALREDDDDAFFPSSP